MEQGENKVFFLSLRLSKAVSPQNSHRVKAAVQLCDATKHSEEEEGKNEKKEEEEEEEGGAKLLEEQTEKNFYMKFKTETRNIPCIQHAVTGSLCTISSVTVHSERYVRLCQ